MPQTVQRLLDVVGKRLVIMKYLLNELNGAQRVLVVQDKLTKSFSETILIGH